MAKEGVADRPLFWVFLLAGAALWGSEANLNRVRSGSMAREQSPTESDDPDSTGNNKM